MVQVVGWGALPTISKKKNIKTVQAVGWGAADL